jgi:hypothetical protein
MRVEYGRTSLPRAKAVLVASRGMVPPTHFFIALRIMKLLVFLF